ncbi:MAG TPA: DUF6675 family protein [Candidatus Acidoferrum sp.]|jgi:hypothetical protein|nr:DUF6675 family protein [Candidatus Acidoferrum sp.]
MLMTILCGRYLSCKRLLLMRLRGSAVLLGALIVPGILTQPADRFLISPIALQLRPLTDVEPQPGPVPPCGREPVSAYPGVNEQAVVKSWSKSDLGRNWKPPGCFGWGEAGFMSLVTIVARFPDESEAKGLLRHIGAISQLAGMRYWSTTRKQWRTLIVNAYALTDSKPGQRREDFTPDEMKEGKVLYFEQIDNLSGKATYRMHIVEVSASRLVFDVENVSTMRYYFIPILHPGELQSMYFLDRETDKVWRYYSIVRTGKNANGLIAGNESSSVNRAVAFYRSLVGIPTTQEPPGAR